MCNDALLCPAGITPIISNEVGLFVSTTVQDVSKSPRNALLQSKRTRFHEYKASKNLANESMLVSFPNDRAGSIRPSDRRFDYQSVHPHSWLSSVCCTCCYPYFV